MKRLAMTHTTYQDASALFMIVNRRQMESRPAVFPALLYIDDVPVLTHHPETLHLVELGGQVHGCLFLFVEDSRIHWTVNIFQA